MVLSPATAVISPIWPLSPPPSKVTVALVIEAALNASNTTVLLREFASARTFSWFWYVLVTMSISLIGISPFDSWRPPAGLASGEPGAGGIERRRKGNFVYARGIREAEGKIALVPEAPHAIRRKKRASRAATTRVRTWPDREKLCRHSIAPAGTGQAFPR